jgi:hypothetical protein
VSRLLVAAAWLVLVAALWMHRLPPRDESPEWYEQLCAEVVQC